MSIRGTSGRRRIARLAMQLAAAVATLMLGSLGFIVPGPDIQDAVRRATPPPPSPDADPT